MNTLQKTTPYGVVEGVATPNGGESYLGIPYAKPPVGPLRWKAPVEPDRSDKLIKADKLGYSAMQKRDPIMAASMREQSEDCLTLNIWVKDSSKKGQPVMVFVHGGAYLEGGSSDPLYDGTVFAERNDVVYVSFNYRVNVFGFMNFTTCPGGEDYAESGYLGSLDQIQAIRWVKTCIAEFGGDPDNITVFGESCGSGSVALLSTTPAARGLFSKFICESGPLQLYNAPEVVTPYAEDFMRMMGCANMAELAAKPAEEVLECYAGPFFEKYKYEVSLLFAPTCDGTLFDRKPLRAFKEGAARDYQMLIGINGNEFNYWSLYFEDPEREMPLFWHGNSKFHFDGLLDDAAFENAYMEAHPEGATADRYFDYTNQIGFFVGSELMAEYQSAYNDAYLYLFDYKSKIPGLGSCHAIELPFVMHNLDDPHLVEGLTGEVPPAHLADEMNDAWVAFAKSGVPACAAAPEWPVYEPSNRALMHMDEHSWRVEVDSNHENREMMRPAFDTCLTCAAG